MKEKINPSSNNFRCMTNRDSKSVYQNFHEYTKSQLHHTNTTTTSRWLRLPEGPDFDEVLVCWYGGGGQGFL